MEIRANINVCSLHGSNLWGNYSSRYVKEARIRPYSHVQKYLSNDLAEHESAKKCVLVIQLFICQDSTTQNGRTKSYSIKSSGSFTTYCIGKRVPAFHPVFSLDQTVLVSGRSQLYMIYHVLRV